MKFKLFINKIKNLKNNFLKINEIIYEVIIKLFPNLNTEEIEIINILTTFLLNVISNKYFIEEIYWEENIQSIKSVILLLLPYLYNYNFLDLNEILYSFNTSNKISSYILQLNKDNVLKQYFKNSNIILGIIDDNIENLTLYENKFQDKLIYKFIEHNLIGLLQTLYIINGKSYINWINIIPINIDNYKKSNIYIHTVNRLQYLSDNLNLEDFKKIESDNLINYNGLWFGDIYNIFRIKFIEDFKNISWLLIPINDEKYLINELNDIFDLENILNLEYYNYNDLPENNQNSFNIKINNIVSLKINKNLIILNKLFSNFINEYKNEFIEFKNELTLIEIYKLLNYLIKFKKINLLWNYLKINIITKFKNSVYSKFLLKKINKYYYFTNYYNYENIDEEIYPINLYILYNLIENLISNDNNINKLNDSKYLDLNYISLNFENKFLFFNRLYSEKKINQWLKLNFLIQNNKIDFKILKEIFKSFQKIYLNIIFEELILSGSLSEFCMNNKEYNKDSIYYLTKDKYLNIAKKEPWQSFYALNWISQINFFHSYIYHQVIYITGATGQGKTTQVPKLLLYASLVIDYKQNPKIIYSEPRISPTIDNAIRVSVELGVPIFDNLKNKTNNYNIQYKYQNDNHVGNLSQSTGFIKFTTDGTLVEEIINNPLLYEKSTNKIFNKVLYDIFVIDEAHEHGVNMDILLALIRNSCYMNNKIKLVIVSATMNYDEPIYRRFFRYINDNLLYPIKSELNHPFDDSINKLFLPQPIYMDRRFDISPPEGGTRYEIIDNYLNRDLDLQSAEIEGINKTLEICKNTLSGGILFFTVGEKEIIKIIKELNIKLPLNCIALPLFSKLNRKYSEIIAKIDENLYNLQYKKELIHIEWGEIYYYREDVPKGTYKRFIIISTNIAEASVTIPDLKYVIDTGFLKTNIFSYEKNITNMIVKKISEVNRIQRRGRVGRISSGIVYYMYKFKSRENIKPFYKITESNIDNLILKLLSEVKYLNYDIDPNIYTSYLKIYNKILYLNKFNIISVEKDNELMTIFKENYFINNKYISEIYFNLSFNSDLFYKGFSIDLLKDINGEFYIIHPNEDYIQRNILNKIINNTSKLSESNIINNLLVNNLICLDSNNKTELGIKVVKFGKDEININDRLNIYYANKYNCINAINEINLFLKIINYSLLELSNEPWDIFTSVYNNYISDIDFIFETIQNIKLTFINLLNDIISLKTMENIVENIEKIKYNFFLKKNISIDLNNKLNGLINNGLLDCKYKSIIFNDYIIQNKLKNYITKEQINDWSVRNLFKTDKILSFLSIIIVNSFTLINNEINYTPIEIYSINKLKQIKEIYLKSYKNQIAYPCKNLTLNNFNYEIIFDKISKKSITVANISYNEIIYVYSKLGLDSKINISIIINK
jgi:hypothetical protein